MNCYRLVAFDLGRKEGKVSGTTKEMETRAATDLLHPLSIYLCLTLYTMIPEL
jgi:hypothetical protein